jgi:hypothetical protein
MMQSDLELRIRAWLQPYLLDGTEAFEKIVLMLHSPSRPPDLRRALTAILRNTYQDAVCVDLVVDVSARAIETEAEKES